MTFRARLEIISVSEVRPVLKAYRDDHIGAIHEQELGLLDDHQDIANRIANRFGLGAFVKANISGQYLYEDGEILTYFQLTPLR